MSSTNSFGQWLDHDEASCRFPKPKLHGQEGYGNSLVVCGHYHFLSPRENNCSSFSQQKKVKIV